VAGRSSSSRLDFSNGDRVTRVPANRSQIAQGLGLLCVLLVVAMGTVQAVHVHPANSQTAHHPCSICSAPTLGPAVASVDLLPMAKAVAMAYSPRETFVAFRPVLVNFVRPPPAV
jgi:hypothetical protein